MESATTETADNLFAAAAEAVANIDFDFDFGNITDPTVPQDDFGLDSGNATDYSGNFVLGSDTAIDGDRKVWSTLLSIMWVVLWMYLCFCQRRSPGRATWRGAEIRERFQRMREREEREKQDPKLRREMIEYNLTTMRITGKDEEGNWVYGDIDKNRSDTSKKGISKLDGDIEEGDTSMEDEEEEDEQLCAICIDAFQVGDVVSWSRYSKECRHMYHTECIQPWLEGKRQDECPSCRNKVILETPPVEVDDTDKPTPNDENLANKSNTRWPSWVSRRPGSS